MRWFKKWRLRFQSLFDRSRVEDDLEDELRDYIDCEIEREVGAGATPEEARRRALSSLGGPERLKEECRDARGVRWLEDRVTSACNGCAHAGKPCHNKDNKPLGKLHAP